MNSSSSTHDVLVVGVGPVGLYLALRLVRAGREAFVVEAREHPYPLPRAVHFDDEIARVLAVAGLTEGFAEITAAAPTYEGRKAAGQALLHFGWSGTGPSGWPIATMFSQPQLEAVPRSVAGDALLDSYTRDRAVRRSGERDLCDRPGRRRAA